MKSFRGRRGITLTLVLLALAACAQNTARKPDEAALQATKRYAGRGYPVEQHYGISSLREAWTLQGEMLDVVLDLPVGPGACPVVVYLPGLGEKADSGKAWRRAWAEAGYAVLSLQSASVGDLLTSPQARSGDFRGLARQQFGPAALAHRLELLRGALARLHELRRSDGASPFRRLDMERVAVAGFDLGAETALAAAGAQVTGRDPAPTLPGVRAVIALSPFADFSGMGTEDVFRPVRLPVLSVTSPGDSDAWGLVTSPSIRRAPFQYMPAGSKWLLMLDGADHSLLSGRESPEELKGGNEGQRSDAAALPDNGGGKRRRSRSASPQAGKAGRSETVPGGGLRGAEWLLEQVRVQSVSLAFLDAVLREDSVAREWLNRDAPRWLEGAATLYSK